MLRTSVVRRTVSSAGLCLICAALARADINQGLLFYYPFDGNAEDYSGSNNDGVPSGGVSYRAGVSGQAVHFDGQSGSIIQLPQPFNPGTQDYSISLWLRRENDSNYIVHSFGASQPERFCISYHYSPYYLCVVHNDVSVVMGVPVPANMWQHLVVTHGTVTKVYLNGTLAAPGTSQAHPSPTPRTAIGGPVPGVTHPHLRGDVDELRFYNRVLTSGEVAYLAEPGPSGNPPADDYFFGYQDDKSGSTADPVNTATGNFFHEETDLTIASRGLPLAFTRYYNSRDSRPGSLGPGWTHSYNVTLTENANQVSVAWGDGRTDYWTLTGGSYQPSTAGLYDTLVKNGDNTWRVTRKNLDRYNFDTTGRLTGIIDKNGNATTLAYNNGTWPNRVTEVTDPANRTLTLAYDANGFLTSVTDCASPPRVVQYAYTSGRLTAVTDVLGHTIQYSYDPNGWLATIIDQRSVTTIINTYDASGRVSQQRDGRDKLTTFAYDTPEADQTTITNPLGKTTVHAHYTGYRLLRSITDELGHVVSYGYDATGNRIRVTDRNGNTTSFIYDARGNVLTTTEQDNPGDPNDGGITAVEYGDSRFPDFPTKKTDALGRITTWEYDVKGNVVRQVDPKGEERLWTYNSYGQKLSEQDERGPGYVTQYVYDGAGKLTKRIDAEGNHTWYAYDALWRLTGVTDGRGTTAGDPNHTTTTAYDNADRVTSITGPITSESYQYDYIGNRTHVTNGRGYTAVSTYDNNSNLTRVERPAPGAETQVTQYAYDDLNRKISMTDPNNHVTAYQYDDAGRLIKVIDAATNETVYTYDAHGNVLTETDGAGVTVTHEYDALHRKIHQFDELSHHWYWQYDKLGRMTRHTDANGKQTGYAYDEFGRLTGVTDPHGNSTSYQYDEVGNLTDVHDASTRRCAAKIYDKVNRLTRQEDGLGNAYVYGYDAVGNQTSVLDANSQTTTLVYDNENRLIETHYPDLTQVTRTYDGSDNLLTVTDPTGTSTFVYDQLDRLTSSTDSYGKEVLYSYDLAGNRTSLTYPADSTNPARAVAYAYDNANRLDAITDWASRVTDYTVDEAGRITQVVYPNGMKELRAYDDAGRLQNLSYRKSDDSPLIGLGYVRDAQGNPTTVNETGTLQPSLAALVPDVHYSYDADNRLTGTDEPATYTHDNNGNMTGRTKGGISTTFAYDVEDRMVSQATGASTVQHVYDGLGNRIARVDNGTATRYILDHGRDMSHILCDTDAGGNIVAYYIHGPQITARIGADDSQRYFLTNQVSSVLALADETQTITDRYSYTPFGIAVGREGTTPNPFNYAGGLGVMAEADGLSFMRARFYEAECGAFLGKDPLESALSDAIGLHRYVFALSNPLVNSDPSGLINWGQVGVGALELVGGTVGMVAGGATGFTGVGLVGAALGASSAYKGFKDVFAGFREDTGEQTTLVQDFAGIGYNVIMGVEGTREGCSNVMQAAGTLESVAGLVTTSIGAVGSLGSKASFFDDVVQWGDVLSTSLSSGKEVGNRIGQGAGAIGALRNVPIIWTSNSGYYSRVAKGVSR